MPVIAEQLGRRRLLRGLAATPLALAAPALAQNAPGGPLRVIVGFAAGGLADITIRLVAEQLSQRLGQPVVVDNRPGAGGSLAARAAAAAEPDGRTLTVLTTGNAIYKWLFRSLPYDPVTDFTAISGLAAFDLLLLTGANSPLRSFADVKGRAGSGMAIATIGAGSTQNIAGEWLKLAAGLDATVVPYRATAEVLTSLQRGDAQLGFESFAAARGAIEGGLVRAIASTGERRSQLLPDLPTLREAGLADYAVTGWNALFAPAGTPAATVALLNRHVTAILATPEMRARLLELGVEPLPNTPQQMGDTLRRDVEVWGEVIRRTGIPPQ
ncbi:Bug family tripartite tricarboxylate transporter substrate binding protein [Roseomonas sp. BN140053]|uniref:Bug family tripartite tricarboxylate transporter substrate binding protein n=1 Tax=Roseomonas sp. BN140053 TaxID=3391898 RepID=UPI0039E8A9F0